MLQASRQVAGPNFWLWTGIGEQLIQGYFPLSILKCNQPVPGKMGAFTCNLNGRGYRLDTKKNGARAKKGLRLANRNPLNFHRIKLKAVDF